MEIQNEKEAFERFKAKQIGIDYETLKKDLDDCEKRFPNNRYAGWNFKSDWELWQAAAAQVVPEGFVLVPKDLVQSIHQSCVNSIIAESMPAFKAVANTIIDELSPFVKAIQAKAQEQSHE